MASRIVMPVGTECPKCMRSTILSATVDYSIGRINIRPDNGPDFTVATGRSNAIVKVQHKPIITGNHTQLIEDCEMTIKEWESECFEGEDPILTLLENCPVCDKKLQSVRYRLNAQGEPEYLFKHDRVGPDSIPTAQAARNAQVMGYSLEANTYLGRPANCFISREKLLEHMANKESK